MEGLLSTRPTLSSLECPCLIFILCHRPPKDSNKVEKKGKPTKKVEEEDNKSEDEEMDAKEDAEDEDGE